MGKNEENKRKKEKYAFLDNLAEETHVTQNDGSGDILNMGFGGNDNTQHGVSSNIETSAFGFDLSGGANTESQNTQNQPIQQVQSNTTGGGSAFGFDLSAGGNMTGDNTTGAQSTGTTQTQSPMMNPMMTQQMLTQNTMNRQLM